MAHNLNYNTITGQHSFMSVKQKAWHGLGQIVDQYPTSAEAMQFAGLDYTVEKRPLFTVNERDFATTNDPNADNYFDSIQPDIVVPNYYATIRTDTDQILGVVGNDYQVVQNADAFSFFDSIVGGEGGILYETAGALGNGERIFITAKLPGFIEVGRDDLIEKYLFLTTSHDGYGSITAAFTPVRIVCQNTLNAALNNNLNSVRIRHTESAQERLKQAHTILGLSNKLTEQLGHIYNRWAKVSITDTEVKKLISLAMAPSKEVLQHVLEGNENEYSSRFKNVIESVSEYAFTDATQQTATTKGTLFGAYNAITGYFNNVKEYTDQEAKLKNIMFGSGLTRSLTAYNLCTKLESQGVSTLQLN